MDDMIEEGRIDKLEQEIKRFHELFAGHSELLDGLHAHFTEANHLIEEVESKVSNVKIYSNSNRQTLGAINTRLDNIGKAILEPLSEAIKVLDTRIEKLESSDTGNNLSFVNLNNAIAILQDEINQLKFQDENNAQLFTTHQKIFNRQSNQIKDIQSSLNQTSDRIENIVEKVADLNKTMDKSWHNFQASYATTNIRIELLDKQFEQFLDKNKALVKPDKFETTIGWIDQFLKDFASTEFNWFGLNEKYKDRIKKYLEGKEPLEVKHIAWIKNFFVKIMKAYFTSDTIMVYDALDDYNKKIARYIEDES